MSEIYQSTKALSVYNVLSLAGKDLAREQVDGFLRRAFDQNLPDEYVSEGVEYLVTAGLATEADGLIRIKRLSDGRGRPVVRSADNCDLLAAAF